MFKGVLVFKALLLGADGTPQVMSRQLPLSQYCELRGDYADDELQVQICVTGSEAELVHMEDEPAKILLSANLLCQCVAMQGYDLTLTEDAYATRGDFSPVWSEVRLPVFARPAVAGGTLRGSVPKQARAVLDSTLYLDSVSQQKKDGGIQLSAPGNSEHSLHGRGRRAPVGNCARPGFLHGSRQAAAQYARQTYSRAETALQRRPAAESTCAMM